MANKNLFKSSRTGNVPVADTHNNAGGAAYSMNAKHALAQMAATGCSNDTFYVSAEKQLKDIVELCAKVSPEFVAKTAIYARERGFMKDMPSFLLASLSKHPELFAKVFPRVIDNPKMLRNVVQMIRSGVTGRKSLGTRPKKVVQERLASWNDVQLFRGSVGNSPSLADVIKMARPKPASEARNELHKYLIGKDADLSKLPQVIRDFEAFKKGSGEVPDVPWEMLTALPLTKENWVSIAKNASWAQTRMNLNTFVRHDVFKTPGMDRMIAERLKNPELIRKAKCFPYQLMVAYLNCEEGVPTVVKNALQQAMEHATENVQPFDCKVVVCNDISGSTHSPITGHRAGATSKVRVVDVAALVASTVLRRNPEARVIPFEGSVRPIELNPFDSIMTNAHKLSSMPGGSTNCSAPLVLLNKERAKVDLVIYVSDYESWVDSTRGRGTATMEQWELLRGRNPKAKMVNIDVTPNMTAQTPTSRNDILNVGGWSDDVWNIINTFVHHGIGGDTWAKEIEKITL